MTRPRLLPLAALLLPLPALAHPSHDAAPGFLAGFLHPMLGPDHLAAMVAVGLWAAIMGGRARWLLPGAFLLAMAAGGAIGQAGTALPFLEHGILASVVVLGALVAGLARLPLAAALPMVGLFGLLHGHAHGSELGMADAASGFLAATALLHLAGLLAIGSGAAVRPAWRVLGGGTAACAAVLLLVRLSPF
jgi:urease accessory protein